MHSRSSESRCGDIYCIVLLVVVAVVLLTNVCQAQPRIELPDLSVPCAPEITSGRRAVVEHGGAPGIWFQREVARCMLGRLAALDAAAGYVRLLEERLTLTNERDHLRERQVELAGNEADAARGALEAAVRARRRAEEELSAWYRQPALWTAVGAVLVVVLEVVAVWAIGEVT